MIKAANVGILTKPVTENYKISNFKRIKPFDFKHKTDHSLSAILRYS